MYVNRWTVTKKLSMLITFALVAAVSFSALFYIVGIRWIRNQNRREIDEKTVAGLKDYVQVNNVRTKDTDALIKWCDGNKRVGIEVFVDKQLVFSSVFDLSKRDYVVEETEREKEVAVPIRFADTEADVIFYRQRFGYVRMAGIGMLISVALFFAIVFIGIRPDIAYMHLINEELQILEGGDLTKEITVKGSSEITTLAESVDEFRKTMKNQLAAIEELEKSNRMMSAEIAHDLRTPLTSLIMYLDFALEEIGENDAQAEEYLSKAREKSLRLKNLLEQNFSYTTMQDFFVTKKQKVEANEALNGYIGDILTHLEGEGFHVRSDINFGHGKILIQRDAVGRVFENLLTNLMKYAKRDEEVFLCCCDKEKYVEIQVQNSVRIFEGEKPESTGFGYRISKRLMEEMDGEYITEESEDRYTTILRFSKAIKPAGERSA